MEAEALRSKAEALRSKADAGAATRDNAETRGEGNPVDNAEAQRGRQRGGQRKGHG